MSTATNSAAPGRNRWSSNWVFLLFLTGIIIIALWQIRSILLLTFTSIVLVIFFTIPIRRLTKITLPFNGGRKMSRGAAILITLVGVVLVLMILSAVVFPQIIEQFVTLINTTIPAGIARVSEWWDGGRVLNEIPFLENVDLTSIFGSTDRLESGAAGVASLDIVRHMRKPGIDPYIAQMVTVIQPSLTLNISQSLLQDIGGQLLNALGTVGGSVIPLLGGVANFLLSMLIVIFVSMYFLAEPGRYVDRIILYTPVGYRSRMRTILNRMDEAIRAWLKITGVSMLVAGILTGILLLVLADLRTQWAALGVIAGVASFIPNFGPLLALIPALLVGAVQTPQNLLLIVLIVYGVSFVQSQVVSPILANEDMNMPPVLILIGQIVFGIFFGFLGIMFAVPLMAILLVLLDEVYVKDVLGDRESVPDELIIEPMETPESYGTA